MWRITRRRRTIQFLFLIIMAIIPLTNVFRMDLIHHTIWIGMQAFQLSSTTPTGGSLLLTIYFSLLAAFILFLIATTFLAERYFCGFLCPHNTFSEIVDSWALYFFGRRSLFDRRRAAGVGKRVKGRGAWRAVRVLLGILLAFAAFFAVTLVTGDYLAPIGDLWRQWARPGTAGFTVFWSVFLFWVIDVALVRHLWCKVCGFGAFYQRLFDFISEFAQYGLPFLGRGLQVQPIRDRQSSCISCNLCERICPVEVPIISVGHTPDCISCGACVDACAIVLRKKGLPSVIDYAPPGDPTLSHALTGKGILRPGRRLLFLVPFLPFIIGFSVTPMLSETTVTTSLQTTRVAMQEGRPVFLWKLYVRNNTVEPLRLSLRTGTLAARVQTLPQVLVVPPSRSGLFRISVQGLWPLKQYTGSHSYPVRVDLTDPHGNVVWRDTLALHDGGSLG